MHGFHILQPAQSVRHPLDNHKASSETTRSLDKSCAFSSAKEQKVHAMHGMLPNQCKTRLQQTQNKYLVVQRSVHICASFSRGCEENNTFYAAE